MKRLEALLAAFSAMNGLFDPSGPAMGLRNPLLLRAFSPKHERDAEGRRQFKTFTAGIDNGLLDLAIKCSGKSRAKLTPDSTLTDLVCVYGNPASAARFIKNHLRHSLHDDSITEHTKLSFFLDDIKEEPNA